ncbi:MAG: hypothetical protein AB1609_10270 [Bacillota bacterium]
MLPVPALRKGLLGLVAVAFVAAAPGPASSSIRVSPLMLDGDAGHAGGRLGPVYVTNTSGQPVPVQVELAGLTHDPDGYPVFLTDPEHRDLAIRSVRPSWTSAELRAGETRALWFDVHRPPHGGVYLAALVRTPVPTGSLVVAVLLFLRGPGASTQPSLRLEGVWAEQETPNQPVQVVAQVRNTGARDETARGEALLVGPDGQLQGRIHLGPATVLPGAVRLLRAEWRPGLLPPGRYVVQAALAGQGGAAQKLAAGFDVIRPYELARLAGALSLAVEADAAGIPVVVASVHNRSSRPVAPVLEISVTAKDGEKRSTTVRGPTVEPGAVDRVQLPWPAPLSAGEYQVDVEWLDGARRVAQAALSLAVAPSLARGSEGRATP